MNITRVPSAAFEHAPAWFESLVSAVPSDHGTAFHRVPPADRSPRRSAVLILFGPGTSGPEASGPDLLLTQRSAALRSHAGQVAFPGGRIDPDDASPEAAAVREAVEETGLDPTGVAVRASGRPLYVSVTNYLVTPVIAWWAQPSPVAPGDPSEVARVVRVPVREVIDPSNRFQTLHPGGWVGPGFEVGDLFVWGFTAGVLDWALRLAGLEQPWDRERRRPVPIKHLTDRTLVQELTEQLDERVSE